MRIELDRMGHEGTICPDGLTAAAALERNSFDCLLVDLDMPGLSGIQVIAKAKELSPETDAIVLTGKSTVDSAIAALRHGAFDYLTKPCKLAELETLLERVLQKRELTNKYRALKRRLERVEGPTRLVGDSPLMNRVRQLIAKVAPTHSSVLILGETGTGKELVARALHEQSLRSDQPFVAINCGALPETMQAKLLRWLESGEIRRVGENESATVDVRLVCATHRRLDDMADSGDFRGDLMFRINTFEIHLPNLRQRIEDIPPLARHLLQHCRQHVRPDDEMFMHDAMALLKSHGWPGNVRELANVVEHASILCEALPISVEHLPERFDARKPKDPQSREAGPHTLRELEMQTIHQALERNKGNKPKAAEELGISLKTLYNKLHQESGLERSA